MDASDLSSIYGLFTQGMWIGGALSAIPFIIGLAIDSLVKFFKS